MKFKQALENIERIETNYGSVPRQNRSKYISVAIGATLASIADLPSSPVANINQHWLLTIEPGIKNTLSSINEHYIFNIKLALTIARQVYTVRYRRVYDPELIVSELQILMPDHVSKLPSEVEEAFSELGENQKHYFAKMLIPSLETIYKNSGE